MSKLGIVIYQESNNTNCKVLAEQCKGYEVVVCNDFDGGAVIPNTRKYHDRKYYAACVNDGLRELKKAGCEHLFILKDTCILQDTSIFDNYVNAFVNSGLHILFNGEDYKMQFDFKDSVLNIFTRFNKEFIYMNVRCITEIGFLDERYKDSFEILDYYYRLYNKGLAAPVGYFPSVANQPVQLFQGKNITTDEDILLKGLKLFRVKYNYTPVEIPLLSFNDACAVFDKIHTRFVKSVV